ncbi:MAG: hypothetical protein DRJ15_16045, partial [Bacteroidetes bacterium]
MSMEQLIAHDQSVVVYSDGDFDLSVPAQNRAVKAILIDETFDTQLPATWPQLQYSGTGLWGWVPGIPAPGGYQPLNSDGNFAACNGYTPGGQVFDVGLFTPSMDMSAAAGPDVTLDFDRNFQDFAGNGDFQCRVYSGGTALANLELTLVNVTSDDPSTGVHNTFVLDPTTFADASDVYVEWWYSCNTGTAWGLGIDNVVINLVLPPGEMWGYVFNGGGLSIYGASVGVEAEGLLTTTDPTGWYSLPTVPGGMVEAYAWKAGYNVTIEMVNILPAGSVQQDFILAAPTMIVSPTFHEEVLNPDEYYTTNTGILNTGDGLLHWNATIEYLTDGVLKTVNIPEFTGQIEQGA